MPEASLVMDAFCHTASHVGHSLHAPGSFVEVLQQNLEALPLQWAGL